MLACTSAGRLATLMCCMYYISSHYLPSRQFSLPRSPRSYFSGPSHSPCCLKELGEVQLPVSICIHFLQQLEHVGPLWRLDVCGKADIDLGVRREQRPSGC